MPGFVEAIHHLNVGDVWQHSKIIGYRLIYSFAIGKIIDVIHGNLMHALG